MKKLQSFRFQVDVKELQYKKLLSLYRRLRKNRTLTRFCREAFIEKAERQLSGLDQAYAQLHTCIQTKGLEYVLAAIQEKEAGASTDTDERFIQKVADRIMLAIRKETQIETPHIAPIKTVSRSLDVALPTETGTLPTKPDMEKLKALLS